MMMDITVYTAKVVDFPRVVDVLYGWQSRYDDDDDGEWR